MVYSLSMPIEKSGDWAIFTKIFIQVHCSFLSKNVRYRTVLQRKIIPFPYYCLAAFLVLVTTVYQIRLGDELACNFFKVIEVFKIVSGSLSETEAASMMAWMSERVDAVGERGYEALSGFMNKNAQGN